MQLGKIIGEVVATQKVNGLSDFKLALVEDVDEALKVTGKKTVAVDLLNCGHGEIVLYTSGSSARQTGQTDKKPVDAVVVGIVDIICAHGKETYKK